MKDPSRETSIAGTVLFVLAGPILWALHFLLVYGGQGTICGWRVDGLPVLSEVHATVLVIAVTIVIDALLIYAAWRPADVALLLRFDADDAASQSFVTKVMRLLTGLSIFGVSGGGTAALIIDACS